MAKCPVYMQNLSKTLNVTKRALSLKMNEVLQSSNNVADAKHKMEDYLSKTLSKEQYTQVIDKFDAMIETSKEKKRARLLKDRPKYVRKDDFQKLIEYSALGEKGKPYLRAIVSKKFGSPDITQIESEMILKNMREAENLPDGRRKNVLIAQIYNVIKNKKPKNLRSKVAAIQRVNLLLNGATQTRNLGSNVGMQVIENLADISGSIVDIAVSKITGKRSVGLPSVKNLKLIQKKFVEGIKEVWEDYKMGILTDFDGGKYDITGAEAFKGNNFVTKVINQLDAFTTMLLRMGDVPFQKATEAVTLKQLMELNNVTTPTAEMQVAAKEDALKKVFQNNSGLAKVMSRIRNAGNGASSGPMAKSMGIFMQTQLPFMKTVSNIVDTGFEYAGGGFIKAFNDYGKLKGGDIVTQRKFVKEISRSLTTSGLMMFAYVLAKAGLINGDYDENKKARELQMKQGYIPYSFNIGDAMHSFDWIDPAAIPLSIGADLHNKIKADDTVAAKMAIGLSTMLSTGMGQVGNLPVVSELRDFSNELGYAFKEEEIGAKVPGIIGGKLLGSATQLIPRPFNQLKKFLDPTKKDLWSGTPTESALKQLGLAEAPVKADPFGRTMKYSEGIQNKAVLFFNAFVNPAKVGKKSKDPIIDKVSSVYNELKKADLPSSLKPQDVFPTNPPTSIGDYKLTPMDKVNYKKMAGETLQGYLKQYFDDPDFDNYDIVSKGIILKKLKESTNKMTKVKFMETLTNK